MLPYRGYKTKGIFFPKGHTFKGVTFKGSNLELRNGQRVQRTKWVSRKVTLFKGSKVEMPLRNLDPVQRVKGRNAPPKSRPPPCDIYHHRRATFTDRLIYSRSIFFFGYTVTVREVGTGRGDECEWTFLRNVANSECAFFLRNGFQV